MAQLQMICVLAGFLWPMQTVENPDFQTLPAFCVEQTQPVCLKCHIGMPERYCK
jgi:hypothetical protein